MFKHRLLNVLIAVMLMVAVMIVFSAHQAGATKTVISPTNIVAHVSAPTSSTLETKRVGSEVYYRLPGGNWVR